MSKEVHVAGVGGAEEAEGGSGVRREGAECGVAREKERCREEGKAAGKRQE